MTRMSLALRCAFFVATAAIASCATPRPAAEGEAPITAFDTPDGRQYRMSLQPQRGSVTGKALGNISFEALPEIDTPSHFDSRNILPPLREALNAKNVFGADRTSAYTLSVTVESAKRPLVSWNARIGLLAVRYELADAIGQTIYNRRFETSSNEKTREKSPANFAIEKNVSMFVDDLSSRLLRIESTEPATVAPIVSPQTPVTRTTTAPTILAEVSLKSFPSSNVNFGTYHALIIGNNRYQYLPGLRSATSDAQKLDQILRTSYGFKTKLLIDASRQRILSELNAYRQTLTERDNLLIYYGGHGWIDEEADEGYWLPIDAESDNPVNWVSNASLTSTVRAMQAKHVLVVADSCFSGKLTRGLKVKIKSQGYLQRMATKRARTALTSGGLEPVLDSGGDNGHSVFASAFFDALNTNKAVIDMSQMFNYIRRQVALDADQIPEYGDIRRAGHKGGDFLFVRTP